MPAPACRYLSLQKAATTSTKYSAIHGIYQQEASPRLSQSLACEAVCASGLHLPASLQVYSRRADQMEAKGDAAGAAAAMRKWLQAGQRSGDVAASAEALLRLGLLHNSQVRPARLPKEHCTGHTPTCGFEGGHHSQYM